MAKRKKKAASKPAPDGLKRPVGRPRKEIDERALREMARIHCTMEEMASASGVSVATLERNYAEAIKGERAQGKQSLRRWMFDAAEKGNTTMMIWLSKNELGYRDKPLDDIGARTVVILGPDRTPVGKA